ncbi:Regulator of ribosome synthesis, partial [Pseudoloma neurophilia]
TNNTVSNDDLALIKQFLISHPSKTKPIYPTFLLPNEKTKKSLTKWQTFANKKGIKKKRCREIYDCKEDIFLPKWGRFSLKKPSIYEEKIGEEKKNEKKKFKKGPEKKTCTNQRFIKQ